MQICLSRNFLCKAPIWLIMLLISLDHTPLLQQPSMVGIFTPDLIEHEYERMDLIGLIVLMFDYFSVPVSWLLLPKRFIGQAYSILLKTYQAYQNKTLHALFLQICLHSLCIDLRLLYQIQIFNQSLKNIYWNCLRIRSEYCKLESL